MLAAYIVNVSYIMYAWMYIVYDTLISRQASLCQGTTHAVPLLQVQGREMAAPRRPGRTQSPGLPVRGDRALFEVVEVRPLPDGLPSLATRFILEDLRWHLEEPAGMGIVAPDRVIMTYNPGVALGIHRDIGALAVAEWLECVRRAVPFVDRVVQADTKDGVVGTEGDVEQAAGDIDEATGIEIITPH